MFVVVRSDLTFLCLVRYSAVIIVAVIADTVVATIVATVAVTTFSHDKGDGLGLAAS